jgi:uncharacterized membrane protein
MSELVVLVVDDPRTAEEMVDALTEMPQTGALLRDVAWVERRPDGKVRMHQDTALVAAGALAGMATGALLGGLVGLLFLNPVAGAVAGAAVGAGEGALAGTVADMGILDDWVRDVGESLTPGRAAVILLVDENRVDDVLAAVERFHPEVKRTTLARTGSEAEFRQQLEERFPAGTAA